MNESMHSLRKFSIVSSPTVADIAEMSDLCVTANETNSVGVEEWPWLGIRLGEPRLFGVDVAGLWWKSKGACV